MTVLTPHWLALAGLVAFGLAPAAPAQAPELGRLAEIEQEPKLEKRSDRALSYARAAVARAVDAYEEGRPEQAREILASIVQAAEISRAALEETGKVARKKPKPFKKAEIDTRKLLKELQDAQRTLTFEERPDFDPAITRIDEINQSLLFEIMQIK